MPSHKTRCAVHQYQDSGRTMLNPFVCKESLYCEPLNSLDPTHNTTSAFAQNCNDELHCTNMNFSMIFKLCWLLVEISFSSWSTCLLHHYSLKQKQLAFLWLHPPGVDLENPANCHTVDLLNPPLSASKRASSSLFGYWRYVSRSKSKESENQTACCTCV